jgi:hypothetical protein
MCVSGLLPAAALCPGGFSFFGPPGQAHFQRNEHAS